MGNTPTIDFVYHRIEQAPSLTFKLMRDRVILFRRDAADAASAFGVLHHQETPGLVKALREIKRVCGRVIIREDIFGVALQRAESSQRGIDLVDRRGTGPVARRSFRTSILRTLRCRPGPREGSAFRGDADALRAKTKAEGRSSPATIGNRGARKRILVVGLAAGQPVRSLAATAVAPNLGVIH